MAAPAQVTIGAKHTQNNMDTPFNNNCDQEDGGEIVYDELDDDQEKVGEIYDDQVHDDQDKVLQIVDNLSMASPTQYYIGNKHTQNIFPALSKRGNLVPWSAPVARVHPRTVDH